MFTLEQIKSAHSKVKSGADFPAYIRDIISLGVTYYETFLTDGHSEFHGKNNFNLASQPRFDAVSIPDHVNKAQLEVDLAHHQQGRSGYEEIVRQFARDGVNKWGVCLDSMTCTYYDKLGNKILVEKIPQ